MNVVNQKNALRKEMLKKRALLNTSTKEKYDQWICDALLKKMEDLHCKTIHCYLPMATEINITPLIAKLLEEKITVIVPKTLPNRKLKNLVLKSLNAVEKGVFGTTYPSGNEEFEGELDFIIVPGLAFDSAMYRLGYGGGHYDNFMANHPFAHKIGAFYPFQEVEKVPSEDHDLPLDEILVNGGFLGG